MLSNEASRALSFAFVLGGLAFAACTEETGSGTSNTTASTQSGGGGTGPTGGGGSGGSPGGSGGTTTSGGSGGATTTATTTTTTSTGSGGATCTGFVKRWGGDTAADEAHFTGAVVDTSGGVIAAGEIVGTVNVGVQAIASVGGSDLLLVRISGGGGVAWAKRVGAGFDEHSKGVAALPDGGAVIVGTFDGSVDFGGVTLTSIAGPDAFVLRIDEDGNLGFVLQFENADARAVTVDDNGDIFVAGDFMGSSTFGQVALTSSANDVFVARISSAGDVIAAKGYASVSKAGALAIASGSGSTYVTGSFTGAIDFGTGSLPGAGSRDVVLARLDANLDATFVKRYGDDTSQEARAVAVLSDGSAVIAGGFRGTLDFDGTSLVADTQDDVFVARVDQDASIVFARRFGDAAEQGARAVAIAGNGDLLVAGGFKGSLNAGDGPITSADGEDVFLARLDPMGAAVQTMRWGGALDQRARTVSVSPCGALVIGGDFTGSLPWDGQTFDATGALDIFVSRIEP